LRLIDVPTLSRLLNVKPKTIYDWIRRDYVPYLKLSQLVRFDEDEIKKWLASKKSNKSSTVAGER
jgi:excisionase family DNA binding protein